MDFDSTSFDLPYGLERFSSRAGVVSSDLVKNYGTSLEVAAHRWERWVVKLAFEKQAVKGGCVPKIPSRAICPELAVST